MATQGLLGEEVLARITHRRGVIVVDYRRSQQVPAPGLIRLAFARMQAAVVPHAMKARWQDVKTPAADELYAGETHRNPVARLALIASPKPTSPFSCEIKRPSEIGPPVT